MTSCRPTQERSASNANCVWQPGRKPLMAPVSRICPWPFRKRRITAVLRPTLHPLVRRPKALRQHSSRNHRPELASKHLTSISSDRCLNLTDPARILPRVLFRREQRCKSHLIFLRSSSFLSTQSITTIGNTRRIVMIYNSIIVSYDSFHIASGLNRT